MTRKRVKDMPRRQQKAACRNMNQGSSKSTCTKKRSFVCRTSPTKSLSPLTKSKLPKGWKMRTKKTFSGENLFIYEKGTVSVRVLPFKSSYKIIKFDPRQDVRGQPEKTLKELLVSLPSQANHVEFKQINIIPRKYLHLSKETYHNTSEIVKGCHTYAEYYNSRDLILHQNDSIFFSRQVECIKELAECGFRIGIENEGTADISRFINLIRGLFKENIPESTKAGLQRVSYNRF